MKKTQEGVERAFKFLAFDIIPEDWIKMSVLPINDIREHDEFSNKCSCKPKFEDGVLVHNSFDGREYFEKDNDKYIGDSVNVITRDIVEKEV